MEYHLQQTGQEVQEILNQAPTTEENLQNEITRSTNKDNELETAIENEETRAEGAEANLQTAIENEVSRAEGVEGNLQTAIESEVSRAEGIEAGLRSDVNDIEGKIPTGASDQNKLATEGFVNSSISTNTADFKGTYNSIEELQTEVPTATANDYAFVISTDASGNTVYNRYKYVAGEGWQFEYALNNSSFTAAQWSAINSAITSVLVAKLNGLPTAAELTQRLNAIIDSVATEKTRAEGIEAGLRTDVNTNAAAIVTEKNRAQGVEGTLQTSIVAEENRAKAAETLLQQNINAEAILRDNGDDALQAEIDEINAKIPTQASASNQLADKAFVNSSIATNTGEFKGTYNSLAELQAVTNVNANDYGFVIATDGTGNTVYNRYKYVTGHGWQFEYALNNSTFTAAQWGAINSGITAALAAKINGLPDIDALNAMFAAITSKIPANASSSNKLVDYAQLVAALATKQNTLTFDNVPTDNSNNPVKSGGVYSAIATVTAAIVGLQSSKQDVLTFDQYPTPGSNNPVRSTGIYSSIENAVAPKANQTDLDNAVIRISTNEVDIAQLQAAYRGLTQNDVVPVAPTDTWPVANPQENVIYRVADRTNTPPQYYTDYMWNGTVMVLMAQYNNAIDSRPKKNSQNLVTSGGVYLKYNPDIKITPYKYLDPNGVETDIASQNLAVSDYFYPVIGTVVHYAKPVSSASYKYLFFYNIDKVCIGALHTDNTTPLDYTLIASDIPAGTVYLRSNCRTANSYIDIPADNQAKHQIEVYDALCKKTDEQTSLVSSYKTGMYLSSSGTEIEVQLNNFAITDYYVAEVGVTVNSCHAASNPDSDYTYICFYDKEYNFVGRLRTQEAINVFDYTLISGDIPQGAVYFRAAVDPRKEGAGISSKKNINIVQQMSETNLDLYGKIASLKEQNTQAIGITTNYYLLSDGTVKSAGITPNFNVTDYCPVKAGITVYEVHAASNSDSDYTYICFYDKSLRFVGRLVSSSTSRTTHTITADEIPQDAAYFRATIYGSGYVDYRMTSIEYTDIENIEKKEIYGGFFDYKTALSMDKNTLIECVESASNGRCTVIFDNEGYPSLMYKIPKIAIGAFDSRLGDLQTPHPAFIVDNVTKECIYMAVFHTSVYEGHYVSWFGLTSNARINIDTLRTGIAGKGNGWHIETIYERSLLSHLARKFNSPKIRGNAKFGMSSVEGYEHEQVQLINGYLPGSNSISHTGMQWYNGTQPAAWSHNGELWGIQDVIGAFHEICDLVKLVNGHIYLATDNKFFTGDDDVTTFENNWVDTGATYDYINGNITLSNTITGNTTSYFNTKQYIKTLCTSGYDTISEDMRKKLALLMLAPRLSSEATEALYDVNGVLGIRNHDGSYHGIFGGAEEYSESGLGYFIIAYNLAGEERAHWNMGSRMVYIP